MKHSKYTVQTSGIQSTRHITLFQLFENLIRRHTGCQKLFQHSFSLNLLSSFGSFRLSGSLLGLQLCDFFSVCLISAF